MLHRTGSGRPLMLLHCLGVDHKFWDFAAPLAGKFALLRYDLPGHGTPLRRIGPTVLRICPRNSPIFCAPKASPA